MGNEGDDEEDDARAEKTKKPPMAAQNQYPTEASNDETACWAFSLPTGRGGLGITDWSTAAPTETKMINQGQEATMATTTRRATTTTAQHSGGPCSSTSWNLRKQGHHQALNAYHIHPHKWPENPPSAADQIRSAADRKPSAQPQTLNCCPIPAPFISWLSNDSHDDEDNK
uniref:Uncharacterized protein n=1 Tax=Fagus sylvatica TaxID=28930 RepID=A0A2N9EQA3_FAGSY